MPETGTSGSMSGAGKRSGLLVATAPHLDSTRREAVGPRRRKGGALAPPKSSASLLFLPRLPHGLRPQAAREVKGENNQRASQRRGQSPALPLRGEKSRLAYCRPALIATVHWQFDHG